MSLSERIKARVSVSTETGCWVWQGQLNTGGYGRIKVGSRTDGTRRNALVHRVAYEVFVGPIPDGLTLDHDPCNNPPCCNPDHLVPRTMKANTLRSEKAVTAINARKVACTTHNTPLITRKGGGRVCPTCQAEYWKARWQATLSTRPPPERLPSTP